MIMANMVILALSLVSTSKLGPERPDNIKYSNIKCGYSKYGSIKHAYIRCGTIKYVNIKYGDIKYQVKHFKIFYIKHKI